MFYNSVMAIRKQDTIEHSIEKQSTLRSRMRPKEPVLNIESCNTFSQIQSNRLRELPAWIIVVRCAQHGVVRDRIRIEDVSIKDKSARRISPLEERKVEWKNRFAVFACNVVLFSHRGCR